MAGIASGQEMPEGEPLHIRQILACRNQITALAIGVNTVWAGSVNGIAEFERNSGRPMAEYGIPEGLQDPQVTALATDGRGHLWVGTPSGLFQSTGQGRFEPVPGRQKAVTAMGYGAGALWVGSAAGLERWNGHDWLTVETLGQETPTRIVATGAEVWALSSRTLARVAGGAATWIQAPPEMIFRNAWIAAGRTYVQTAKNLEDEATFARSPVFEVRGGQFVPMFRQRDYYWDYPLAVDAQGRFWVRHMDLDRDDHLIPGGLRLWDEQNGPVSEVSGLPSRMVHDVAAADGTMGVMTAQGAAVCTADGTVVQRYASAMGPAAPLIDFMLFRGARSVFLSSAGAVSLYDGKTWTQVPLEARIATAVLDRGGDVVAFGYEMENDRRMPIGFFVLSRGTWKKVERFPELIERGLFTVGGAATAEGHAAFLGTEMWMDRPDQHLLFLQDGQWLERPAPGSLNLVRDHEFDLLAAGPEGRIAAAGGNQLFIRQAGAWLRDPVPVEKDSWLRAVRMDRQGNVWLLYRDRILRRAAGGGWQTWPGRYGLLDVGPDGRAWALPQGIPAQGELTLVSFAPGRAARHRVDIRPLQPSCIADLRFDELGQMWLSTDRGVWRITR